MRTLFGVLIFFRTFASETFKLIAMDIRIRVKKLRHEIVYFVQVKRFLFWKTLAYGTTFKEIEDIVENLKKVNDINTPKNNEVVFNGWMVRNQYENTGISYVIDVYSEYPEYKRSDDKKTVYWSGVQIASIKTRQHLFGEIGLEPRKVKITIEKL
jgi:hypothetical protein